ncbi:hypothetical protein [Streptomyces hygroscopicus]|uniref:hypothetical protein n=1 Tax=Streptomyces hygroscopicus TaxID=1912 RepID=UPI0033F72711
MNIGKQAVLLTAAAGALVIGGAGGALAHNHDDLIAQINNCDTHTGAITQVGGMAPTGEVEVGADCVNFTNIQGQAVLQENNCDTTTGPIMQMGGASPTRDVNVGAKCANIAVNDNP